MDPLAGPRPPVTMLSPLAACAPSPWAMAHGVIEQKLHALIARLPRGELIVNRPEVIERQGCELVPAEGRADQVTQRSRVVPCGHRVAPLLTDRATE